MDLSRVEQLIELMRQSGLTQLSLEVPDFKISITRGSEDIQVTTGGEAGKAAATAENPAPRVDSLAGQASVAPRNDSRALPVVSPVVGVFHNGGMLDPREMVREGDRVREGQLVAAVEAMKVPNELRAPASGVVARLLVEDGAAVEYGQTLLLIEPEEGGEESDEESMVGLA